MKDKDEIILVTNSWFYRWNAIRLGNTHTDVVLE